MNRKLLFLLLVIGTPFFWWNLIRPQPLFSELAKFPQYLTNQTSHYFSVERINNLDDARWYSLNPKIGKLFFNKFQIIPDELSYGLQAISPHNFYTSAGNLDSTPPNTPAIPFILLPFTLIGIYLLIKDKKLAPFIIFFSTLLIPFLTGQPTLYYLFPTLLVYLYFSYYSIKSLTHKQLVNFLLFDLIYNLYIITRLVLLS